MARGTRGICEGCGGLQERVLKIFINSAWCITAHVKCLGSWDMPRQNKGPWSQRSENHWYRQHIHKKCKVAGSHGDTDHWILPDLVVKWIQRHLWQLIQCKLKDSQYFWLAKNPPNSPSNCNDISLKEWKSESFRKLLLKFGSLNMWYRRKSFKYVRDFCLFNQIHLTT